MVLSACASCQTDRHPSKRCGGNVLAFWYAAGISYSLTSGPRQQDEVLLEAVRVPLWFQPFEIRAMLADQALEHRAGELRQMPWGGNPVLVRNRDDELPPELHMASESRRIESWAADLYSKCSSSSEMKTVPTEAAGT